MTETETDNPALHSPARRSRLLEPEFLAAYPLFASLVSTSHPGRFLISFCIAIGALIAACQVYLERPMYSANAEILLKPVDASQLTLVYSGTAKRTVVSLPVEAQILTSDTVLGRVAKVLDLANDSRFSPFAQAGRRYDDDQPEVRAAMIAKLRDSLTVRYDVFKSDDPQDADNLGSTRHTKSSNRESGPRIMYLTVTSSKPALASAIVSREIEVYTDRNLELRHDAMLRVASHLSASMDEFKRKVESEQRALLALNQRSGLVGMADDGNPDQLELLQLGRASSQAKMQANSMEAANAIILSKNSAGPGLQLPYASYDIQLLRDAIHLVRLQLSDLETTLGPSSPSIRELQARKSRLEDELSLVESRIEKQLVAAPQRVRVEADLLGSEVDRKARQVRSQQGAGAESTTLRVQFARDSELYYVLVNNVRTAEIDAGYGSIAVEILKQPDTPEVPNRKDYIGPILLYSIAGFVAGVLLAHWLASRSHVSRTTHRQLEQVLRMRCLAEIPWSVEARKSGSGVPVLLSNPGSDFAHTIAVFADALLLAPASGSIQRIMLTGVAAGQGTTTVAVNAAIALAKRGIKVLLIDAAAVSPSIHRRMRLEGCVGLGNVLRGDVGMDAAVVRFPGVPELDILPAGQGWRIGSLELRERLRACMEWSERRYRIVILDTASIQHSEETATIASLAELTVLVLREGGASRREVAAAGANLRESGARLCGLLLVGRELNTLRN